MSDHERYEDIIRRLAALEYDVGPDGSGYIIRHRSDPDDNSHACHLDDLEELTQLYEWAARRRAGK